MTTVTVVIGEDGSATVGVGCVKGKKCVDLTKDIEKALGKVTEDQKTAEFYQVENVQANH
jgi:hypothetical protein